MLNPKSIRPFILLLNQALQVNFLTVAKAADNRSQSERDPPPGAPVPPILPPQDGYLALDRAKFAASFAADVEPCLANFMANAQVPWGLEALNGEITKPA